MATGFVRAEAISAVTGVVGCGHLSGRRAFVPEGTSGFLVRLGDDDRPYHLVQWDRALVSTGAAAMDVVSGLIFEADLQTTIRFTPDIDDAPIPDEEPDDEVAVEDEFELPDGWEKIEPTVYGVRLRHRDGWEVRDLIMDPIRFGFYDPDGDLDRTAAPDFYATPDGALLACQERIEEEAAEEEDEDIEALIKGECEDFGRRLADLVVALAERMAK